MPILRRRGDAWAQGLYPSTCRPVWLEHLQYVERVYPSPPPLFTAPYPRSHRL